MSEEQKPRQAAEKLTPQQAERKTVSGTSVFGGRIYSEDYNPLFSGKNAILIYEKMRRSNATVSEICDLVTLPIRSANWYVKPFSEEDIDKEVSDFIHMNLFEKLDSTWDGFLEAGLDMIPLGFSAFEKTYHPIMYNGERKYIVQFHEVIQKTIQKWETKDGEPGIYQTTASGRTASVPLEDMMIFTYRKKGDDYNGRSILRAAYPHWYYNDNYYRIEAIGHERSHVGIPKVTTPQGADPEDKQYAEEIASNIRANEQQFLSLPHGYDASFMDMSANTTDIQPAINHHNLQMAHAALIAFAFGGSTPNGSRATSVDLSSMFLHAMKAVANQFRDKLNAEIVRLVDFNFENFNGYPTIGYSNLEREDISELSTTVQRFSQAGVDFSDEESQQHIRKLLQFPERKDVDDAPVITKDPEEDKSKASEKPAKKSDVKVANNKRKTSSDSAYGRMFTAAESKVDFEGLERRIERAEESIRENLTRISEQQIESIISQISIAIDAENTTDILNNLTISLRNNYGQALVDELRPLFEYAKTRVSDEMSVDAPSTDPEEADRITAQAESLSTQHAETLAKTAATVAIAGYSINKLRSEIVQDVRNQLAQKAEQQIRATSQAQSIATVNQGRSYVHNIYRSRIYAFQYSAILDYRTCNFCLSLDQKTVATDSRDYYKLMPPQHFACRCIWVEILTSEEDKPEITDVPAEIPRDNTLGTFKQLTKDQAERLAEPESINETQQ